MKSVVKYYIKKIKNYRFEQEYYELVSYMYRGEEPEDSYVEIENTRFDGELTFVDYYRGRSAAGLEFIVKGHPSGYEFHAEMGISAIGNLFRNYSVDHGVVSGEFKLAKKGANYFVVPALGAKK